MIAEAGIYPLSEAEYHADPCAVPSLSRSIARLLIEASPAHAFVAHPRLGGLPHTGPASGDDDMDVGTVAHAMFLQGVQLAVRVDVKAWTTNAAKEQRREIQKAGKIALKAAQYDNSMRVVDALEKFRAATGMFTKGKPEQSVIWHEDEGIWCRARVDWLPEDPSEAPLDLKTTAGLATLAVWSRRAFDAAADIQAAMYPRGLELVRGEPPAPMQFVVIETKPPYGVRVYEMDRITVEIGDAKTAQARAIWLACMQAKSWPLYSLDIEYVLPPPWIVRQWEETRMLAGNAGGHSIVDRMIEVGSWGG